MAYLVGIYITPEPSTG